MAGIPQVQGQELCQLDIVFRDENPTRHASSPMNRGSYPGYDEFLKDLSRRPAQVFTANRQVRDKLPGPMMRGVK
jgi:hypothetical protein